jgi:hypothetical protein
MRYDATKVIQKVHMMNFERWLICKIFSVLEAEMMSCVLLQLMISCSSVVHANSWNLVFSEVLVTIAHQRVTTLFRAELPKHNGSKATSSHG